MIFRATICGARIIWPLFFAHLSSQTDIRIASEVYEIMQTVYIPATKLKFIKATQKKVDQKLIKYITEAITSMNQHHHPQQRFWKIDKNITVNALKKSFLPNFANFSNSTL